jgi:phage terminase large subunit-like protein
MPDTLASSSALKRWRAGPAAFVEEMLVNPETGEPFTLLPCEREFMTHAFVTGDDGRLLYSEWLYAAPKKSGKTTFAAILTITVIVLYGGRFAEGVIAANDFEQAHSRVHQQVRRIIEASPLLTPEAQIIAGKVTLSASESTIVAIPSGYASAAGANPNISVFDELWAFTTEAARRLFDELVVPPTRKIACRLIVTYAGFEGESELLIELHRRGMAQPLVGPDLHAGDGILCYWTNKVQAPWQTPAWLADMRRSLRPAQFDRMILNKFVSSESSFIDMQLWDTCTDPRIGHHVTDRTLKAWAAIDASVKHDSTAMTLTHFDNAYQRVKLLDHKIFTPSPGRPIDFAAVEQAVIDWHHRYILAGVYYDPFQMVSSAQRLAKAGVKMIEFPQSLPNLTIMAENLFDLIRNRSLLVYPDEAIRLAVSRAIAKEGARGWKIDKTKATHHIDVVVSLGMAALAAVRGEAEPQYLLDVLAGTTPDDEPPPPAPRRLWPGMSAEREAQILATPPLIAREFLIGELP